MHKLSTLCILTTIALTVGGQAHAGTAFSLSSPNAFTNGSWAFGQIFTVGAADISVTALGAYDAGGDGFASPDGLPVGIYRESDTTLLASATVTSSDTLDGDFRYASITPLTLLSGDTYRVVAVSESDPYNYVGTYTVDPAITSSQYAYCGSTVLTSCNDQSDSGTLWMANFEFGDATPAVPEPFSIILTGAGLAALACVRARHRAVARR